MKYRIYFVIAMFISACFIQACSAEVYPEKRHDNDISVENSVAEEKHAESSIDSEKTQKKPEAVIKELYVEKLSCIEEARACVLSSLYDAKYIDLSQDYRDSFGIVLRDELVDGMIENEILSAAVKTALNAVAEKKSAEEILADTLKGAKDGVVDYIKGLITGGAEETVGLGVDLFKVNDIINEFKNLDDVPVDLANGLILRQRSDISIAVGIASKDDLDSAGIYYLAALMSNIRSRQSAIAAATDKDYKDINICDILTEIAGRMAVAEAKLSFYANSPDGNISDITQDHTIKITDNNLINAYDVMAVREGIKNLSATSKVFGAIGGSIGGNLAEKNADGVNKEGAMRRLDYMKILENRLSNNIPDLCAAKADYVGAMSVTDDPKEATSRYCGELSTYLFDLKLVSAFYGISLSEKERPFLDSLDNMIEETEEFLLQTNSDGAEGYTREEKLSAIKVLVTAFLRFEDWERGTSYCRLYDLMGEIKCDSAPTVKIYGNNGIPLLLLESHSLNYYGQKGLDLKLYDRKGNPLYEEKRQGKLYSLDGEVLGFDAASDNLQSKENAEKLYSEAVKTMEGIMAGTLKSGYKSFWW